MDDKKDEPSEKKVDPKRKSSKSDLKELEIPPAPKPSVWDMLHSSSPVSSILEQLEENIKVLSVPEGSKTHYGSIFLPESPSVKHKQRPKKHKHKKHKSKSPKKVFLNKPEKKRTEAEALKARSKERPLAYVNCAMEARLGSFLKK